ncbi:MAG: hypothetical protein ABIJ41_05565 [Candidatus Omnitrophota bacterium]
MQERMKFSGIRIAGIIIIGLSLLSFYNAFYAHGEIPYKNQSVVLSYASKVIFGLYFYQVILFFNNSIVGSIIGGIRYGFFALQIHMLFPFFLVLLSLALMRMKNWARRIILSLAWIHIIFWIIEWSYRIVFWDNFSYWGIPHRSIGQFLLFDFAPFLTQCVLVFFLINPKVKKQFK